MVQQWSRHDSISFWHLGFWAYLKQLHYVLGDMHCRAESCAKGLHLDAICHPPREAREQAGLAFVLLQSSL